MRMLYRKNSSSFSCDHGWKWEMGKKERFNKNHWSSRGNGKNSTDNEMVSGKGYQGFNSLRFFQAKLESASSGSKIFDENV